MITLEKETIYITEYDSLKKVSDNNILIYQQDSYISITGDNLRIGLLSRDEISIIGTIEQIQFQYEK